jgi:hypothetical protein
MICVASNHAFGSCIYLQDTKIQFDFKSNLTSAISDFSKSQHLASYISRHNAMAYDKHGSNAGLFFDELEADVGGGGGEDHPHLHVDEQHKAGDHDCDDHG